MTLVGAYGLFPLLMLAFIVRYTKPYPIWETWVFIDVWRQFADGGPWFQSLFIPRWGHIHAIPNFMNLLVGSVSGYSMLTDTVVAWAVTVVALFVIARQASRNVLLALGLASALFTARLAEVWLNSWDLMWGLSLLQATLIGTCLARPTPRSFAMALLIGASSIITAGQGVAIVAAGLVPLALHAMRNRRASVYLLIWAPFVYACLRVHEALSGTHTPISRLLAIDPRNVFGLLGFALGEGSWYAGLLLIFTGVAVGYGLWRRKAMRPTRQDLFWIYMVTMLLVFTTLLSVTRPGQFLSRYLMLLWIAPTAIAYLTYRASEGHAKERVVWSVLCVAWIALNVWGSVQFQTTVAGWEPLSRDVVSLSHSNPSAVRAEMLKGVSSNDVDLMAKGLAIMKALHVNIYCRP